MWASRKSAHTIQAGLYRRRELILFDLLTRAQCEWDKTWIIKPTQKTAALGYWEISPYFFFDSTVECWQNQMWMAESMTRGDYTMLLMRHAVGLLKAERWHEVCGSSSYSNKTSSQHNESLSYIEDVIRFKGTFHTVWKPVFETDV